MNIIEWWRIRKAVKYLNSLPVDPASSFIETSKMHTIEEYKLAVAGLEFLTAQEQLKEAQVRLKLSELEVARINGSLRPSRIYPINLTNDGMQWVVRLSASPDPRNDLVGTGDSPEKAMLSFDYQWFGQQPPKD